jgi:hypothetical protein
VKINRIFLASALDQGLPLPQLVEETRALEKLLKPLHERRLYQLVSNRAAGLDDVLEQFADTSAPIEIFHYAGHAGEQELHFEGGGHVRGLAALFGLNKQQPVRLAFLNGCGSAGLVERVHAAGVAAVIATRRPVEDTVARRFAETFYREWVQEGKTLEQAFGLAKIFRQTQWAHSAAETVVETRGLATRAKDDNDELPWGLYINPNLSDKDRHATLAWMLNAPPVLPDGERLLTWSDDGATKIWTIENQALIQSFNCANVADLPALEKKRYVIDSAVHPDLTCRPLYPTGSYQNLIDLQQKAETFATWAFLPDWDTTRLPTWGHRALTWYDSTFNRVKPKENPAHWADFNLAAPPLFAVLDSLHDYQAGLEWINRAETLGEQILQRDSSEARQLQWRQLQRSKARFLVLAGQGEAIKPETWTQLIAWFPDDAWLAAEARRRQPADHRKK